MISFLTLNPSLPSSVLQVRSAEAASNCMALDGLVFKDAPLKVSERVGRRGALGIK